VECEPTTEQEKSPPTARGADEELCWREGRCRDCMCRSPGRPAGWGVSGPEALAGAAAVEVADEAAARRSQTGARRGEEATGTAAGPPSCGCLPSACWRSRWPPSSAPPASAGTPTDGRRPRRCSSAWRRVPTSSARSSRKRSTPGSRSTPSWGAAWTAPAGRSTRPSPSWRYCCRTTRPPSGWTPPPVPGWRPSATRSACSTPATSPPPGRSTSCRSTRASSGSPRCSAAPPSTTRRPPPRPSAGRGQACCRSRPPPPPLPCCCCGGVGRAWAFKIGLHPRHH
jgi:hypothetical protein